MDRNFKLICACCAFLIQGCPALICVSLDARRSRRGQFVTNRIPLKMPNCDFHLLNMAQTPDDEFWSQQKALMGEMTAKAEQSLKQEQLAKFAKRRNALIGDTAFFTALVFCILWAAFDNPFFSFSYLIGSLFGLAYAYGLGKYVETIGGSADDTEAVQGAGVGQARFAFLILLFVFVGRFRSSGLLEIPSILGFFTYQLASLSQGLREIDD